MENWETKYNELRNFSKTDTRMDSISKGIAIERIINDLLSDIAKPNKLDLNVNFGKREFDGRITLGKTKNIFYEIELGVLPKFKYYQILADLSRTHFLGKTYFLIIAYNFSYDDKKRIGKLQYSPAIKNTIVSFIDYKNLIALHKFASKIDSPDLDELKYKKKFFLERLLQTTNMITESFFSSAKIYAEDRLAKKYRSHQSLATREGQEKKEILGIFREMWRKPDSPLHRIYSSWEELEQHVAIANSEKTSSYTPEVEIPESEMYAERINRLERIATELLNEIQAIKKDIQRGIHKQYP